jgi:hypothetical protein
MYQIEHSSKYPVPSLGCIVKFVPGCAVISIIGKLSRIQVDPVWPIFLLPTAERNPLLRKQ